MIRADMISCGINRTLAEDSNAWKAAMRRRPNPSTDGTRASVGLITGALLFVRDFRQGRQGMYTSFCPRLPIRRKGADRLGEDRCGMSFEISNALRHLDLYKFESRKKRKLT